MLSDMASVAAANKTPTVGIKAEVLTDLASRFLINLSNEEREDPIKLCSHIELARWYYLDLLRPEDPNLPACNFKEFMAAVVQHCPWLIGDSSAKNLDKLIAQWKTRKYKKPVRGAIILNQDWTKVTSEFRALHAPVCLLVQGYPSGTSWGFPKGKIEEEEVDSDAAVREVYEETGFDIRELIQKDCYLEANVNDSNARMYIIPGVPDKTMFEPRTRHEIRSIQWFKIKELPAYKKDTGSRQALGKPPNNFFTIIPFIGQLRKWLQNKKRVKKRVKTRAPISATFEGSKPNQEKIQHKVQSTSQQAVSPPPHQSLTTPRHKVQSTSQQAVSPPPHDDDDDKPTSSLQVLRSTVPIVSPSPSHAHPPVSGHPLSSLLNPPQHSLSSSPHPPGHTLSPLLHPPQHSLSSPPHPPGHTLSPLLHPPGHTLSPLLHPPGHTLSPLLHPPGHSLSSPSQLLGHVSPQLPGHAFSSPPQLPGHAFSSPPQLPGHAFSSPPQLSGHAFSSPPQIPGQTLSSPLLLPGRAFSSPPQLPGHTFSSPPQLPGQTFSSPPQLPGQTFSSPPLLPGRAFSSPPQHSLRKTPLVTKLLHLSTTSTHKRPLLPHPYTPTVSTYHSLHQHRPTHSSPQLASTYPFLNYRGEPPSLRSQFGMPLYRARMNTPNVHPGYLPHAITSRGHPPPAIVTSSAHHLQPHATTSVWMKEKPLRHEGLAEMHHHPLFPTSQEQVSTPHPPSDKVMSGEIGTFSLKPAKSMAKFKFDRNCLRT